MSSRGAIIGIEQDTNREDIITATLNSIAYQCNDLIITMTKDFKTFIKTIYVDGGASANNLLLQFQADLLDSWVIRPKIIETTALGAAYLAGLAVGFWNNLDEIKQQWQIDRRFVPMEGKERVQQLKDGWRDAVDRVIR